MEGFLSDILLGTGKLDACKTTRPYLLGTIRKNRES